MIAAPEGTAVAGLLLAADVDGVDGAADVAAGVAAGWRYTRHTARSVSAASSTTRGVADTYSHAARRA